MLIRSLSARLLVLTIFFVMLSEVLIFVPSVARFRMTYFDNHIAAGYLATLALAASPTGTIEQPMINLLLQQCRGARDHLASRRTAWCSCSTARNRQRPTSPST